MGKNVDDTPFFLMTLLFHKFSLSFFSLIFGDIPTVYNDRLTPLEFFIILQIFLRRPVFQKVVSSEKNQCHLDWYP